MSKTLIITEKPSVARDVSAALPEAFKKKGDFYESESWVVGSAVGHLVEQVDPDEYDARYKKWVFEDLPILPEEFRYELNLADIAELWRRGSVVGSWLLDLTAIALAQDPRLEAYSGHVQDSGEGRWTIMAALEEAVPADVLSASVYTRFRSRQEHTFAEKVLSAMRHQFGGHAEPSRKG